MLRPPHLNLIARHSVRHSLRGGAGLMAIFLTIATGLLMASFVLSPLEAVDRQLARHKELSAEAREAEENNATQEVIKIGKKAMSWAMDAPDEQIDYLVLEKPALISAILILLMLLAPFHACVAGFNQTSGDIGSRGLRYLLIRTERENLFIGRFIGTVLFMMAVYAILFAVMAFYVAVKIKAHSTSDMVLWLMGGYVRTVIFTIPYIALCAWVSSSIDSPFGALVLALLGVYGWPLFVTIGSMSADWFHYLGYVTPYGYKWWLFSDKPYMVALGVLVMAAWTALFVWFGRWRFQKRDL